MKRWLPGLTLLLLAAASAEAAPSDPRVRRGLDFYAQGPKSVAAGTSFPLEVLAYGFPEVTKLLPLVGARVEARWDPESVGEDLPSAVGLNGAIMTSSRLVGTAIAGVLIATVGATLCLYLNAVSFLAVVVAMQLMRRDQFNVVARSPRGKGQIRQGLRYALGHPEVRVPLAAMAIVGTLAFNQQVTTPLLARITFDAGPGLFAAFGSVGGAGALLGAITAAARRQAGAALIGYAAILLGISALAVALAPTAAVALPLLAIMSFGASMYVSATSTRLQHVADPAFRARVMALNAILFLGSTPVGSVIVSAVSDATNPRVAVGLGGVGALGTGLVVWRRGARRHTGTHGDLAGGPAGAGSDAGARLDVAVKSEG